MDFERAMQILNAVLAKEDPEIFNASWIVAHVPAVYRFIHKNLRTENDQIDWDTVTIALDRRFQKRWVRYRRKRRELLKLYRSKAEVNLIKRKYRANLYTFIVAVNTDDRVMRDRISIALVRIAQKGNITAQRELIELITFTIQTWTDRYWYFLRWKYYPDLLEENIEACMRRYRFSGSFVNYLFKSLAYAGRGLPPVWEFSLDRPIFEDGGATMSDNVVQDPETGEVRMYDRSHHS
jgi:hypothetical protein